MKRKLKSKQINIYEYLFKVYMGQLRNKCVLDVPATANWSLWTNNERNWFIKEGVPELCGNASGAR